MAALATVVETTEAVAEMAAPIAEVAAPVVMTTGCIDYKKTVVIGLSVLAVGLAGYGCYKMVQKRKAAKEEYTTLNGVEIVEPEEVVTTEE